MEYKPPFSLSRIILYCHNVEKLKGFYTEHFQLTITEEIKDEWVVLNAGQVEIALHKIGNEYEPKAGTEFKVESNTKLVFRITEDITALRQRLVEKGVEMRDIKSFEGFSSIFCDGEDPEGNVFQLEQPLL